MIQCSDCGLLYEENPNDHIGCPRCASRKTEEPKNVEPIMSVEPKRVLPSNGYLSIETYFAVGNKKAKRFCILSRNQNGVSLCLADEVTPKAAITELLRKYNVPFDVGKTLMESVGLTPEQFNLAQTPVPTPPQSAKPLPEGRLYMARHGTDRLLVDIICYPPKPARGITLVSDAHSEGEAISELCSEFSVSIPTLIAFLKECEPLAPMPAPSPDPISVALCEIVNVFESQSGRFYECMGHDNPRLQAVAEAVERGKAALAHIPNEAQDESDLEFAMDAVFRLAHNAQKVIDGNFGVIGLASATLSTAERATKRGWRWTPEDSPSVRKGEASKGDVPDPNAEEFKRIIKQHQDGVITRDTALQQLTEFETQYIATQMGANETLTGLIERICEIPKGSPTAEEFAAAPIMKTGEVKARLARFGEEGGSSWKPKGNPGSAPGRRCLCGADEFPGLCICGDQPPKPTTPEGE